MTLRPAALLHPAAALLALLAGLGLRLAGAADAASLAWTLGLWLTGIPLVWRTAAGILAGRFAADLVAALAVTAAAILNQPFAGLVVILMQTGGELLEHMAERRATRAVRDLEAMAPQIAHRIEQGVVRDVPADALVVGDRLVVRPGEMVPCNGVVVAGEAGVDTSRITGESRPVAGRPGVSLPSGSLVLDGPLTLEATARAADSLYARIVELVRTAQAHKAPLQRIADRVAVWFTPATLAVCAIAWGLSGDPLRVLAVLVVATPCPLILATPVAIVGGINRAARRRIILRHGGALEGLSRVNAVIFDKTGTVTLGQPEVESVTTWPGWTEPEVLALTAAVEQGAGHPLARSLVRAADAVSDLPPVGEAHGVVESPGRGVTGRVDERRVTVGAMSLLRELEPDAARAFEARPAPRDTLRAFLAVDGQAAAVFRFADRPRPDMDRVITDLRSLGLSRALLLSGDHEATARAVAEAIGIPEVAGDLLPHQKVEAVHRLRGEGHRVLMIGDGINDAPALAAADVGIALAGHGGGVAAEAADGVILESDPARIPEAVRIASETMRIARQSLGIGLGLSLVAMVFAALGHIPPTAGALLQEGIDLAVIANAIRAAR